MKSLKVSKDTVVRLLTIVFTPIAAGGTAWIAKQGVNLPASEVVTVGALSGAAVLGLGFHWLQRQPVVLKGEQDLENLAGKVADEIRKDPALASSLDVVVSKLDANRGEILAAIEKLVHAPSSLDNLLSQFLASQAAGTASAVTPPAPPPVV